jgi:hypothetical protein
MGYDIETARRYREHAARLRRMAADDEDPKIREKLMQIAQDYERMAQAREEIGVKYAAEIIGGHIAAAMDGKAAEVLELKNRKAAQA